MRCLRAGSMVGRVIHYTLETLIWAGIMWATVGACFYVAALGR